MDVKKGTPFWQNRAVLWVFIKGYKNCCGYIVMLDREIMAEECIENKLGPPSSEFSALNEAIKNIKKEGWQNGRIIKTCSNLEVIVDIIKGKKIPIL